MAGDWMKVEKDTPEKPEILAIASILNLDPEIVFTKCFKLWRWADSQTIDGNVPRVTPARLDELVKMPGFADALSEVGWLHVRTGSLQIPNFGRHMGQGAKKRALTADRVAKSRTGNCNAPGVTESAPEKRREEKRIKTAPQPPLGAVDAFDQFWSVFPPKRKTKKAKAIEAWKKAIKKTSPETIIAAAAEYAASPTGRSQYVLGPVPWLNGGCWDDDRTAWQRGDDNQNGATPHELFQLSAEEQVERTRRETEARRREG